MIPRQTYRGKLGNNNGKCGQTIDDEICQVVVGVMCANEEQHDRYREQELLCWSVLVPVVNLLPHVEIVIGACVEVEGYTADVVEHEVGACHVAEVYQGP